MVQDRRASESPLQHLKAINSKPDRRHERRALTVDESRRLLETTQSGPYRFGMEGPERALLYQLALESGLRSGELRSLQVRSFDLEIGTVVVKAAYSKHRRDDELPLKPDTVEELKVFFAGKLPMARAFNMPPENQVVKMLRANLVGANIPYVDESGRYADFHSLRHTTGSFLAACGVHPKVAQVIMRHSKIDLTMSRYTHVFKGQESEAVAGLPDLSLPSSKQKAAATGTEGAEKNLASCLALCCGKQRISADNNGQKRCIDGDYQKEKNRP